MRTRRAKFIIIAALALAASTALWVFLNAKSHVSRTVLSHTPYRAANETWVITSTADPEYEVQRARTSAEDFLHSHGITNAETIDVGISAKDLVFRFATSGTNVSVVFSMLDRSISFQRHTL
jgi:hypothetical protein